MDENGDFDHPIWTQQDLQLEQLLNVKCLQNFFVGNKLQSAFMSVVSISYSMFFTNTFAFVFIVNISYLSYSISNVLEMYVQKVLIICYSCVVYCSCISSYQMDINK
jgi:hypothetical protein